MLELYLNTQKNTTFLSFGIHNKEFQGTDPWSSLLLSLEAINNFDHDLKFYSDNRYYIDWFVRGLMKNPLQKEVFGYIQRFKSVEYIFKPTEEAKYYLNRYSLAKDLKALTNSNQQYPITGIVKEDLHQYLGKTILIQRTKVDADIYNRRNNFQPLSLTKTQLADIGTMYQKYDLAGVQAYVVGVILKSEKPPMVSNEGFICNALTGDPLIPLNKEELRMAKAKDKQRMAVCNDYVTD